MIPTHTDAPKSAAATALPEFADHKTVKVLFNLSRSFIYQLASEKKIRSISLRRNGAIRGRRLFDCASIRRFIEAASA